MFPDLQYVPKARGRPLRFRTLPPVFPSFPIFRIFAPLKPYLPKMRTAIYGAGNRFGVPTPMNCKVTHLIHRIENGELRPSFDNLRFF